MSPTLLHKPLVVGAITLLLIMPAKAELVMNGGFEADPLSQAGGLLGLQTVPTGWSSLNTGQNVDLIGSGYFGGQAAQGNNFLDLIGNASGSFPSGVQQRVELQAGHSYRLSFSYNGGAPTSVTDPLLEWALGNLDGGAINVGALNVFSGNGRAVTDWVRFTRDIEVSTSSTEWLRFSTPYGDSGGPYLDDVSLVSLDSPVSVPEPGELWLSICALVLAGATTRRRRVTGHMHEASAKV